MGKPVRIRSAKNYSLTRFKPFDEPKQREILNQGWLILAADPGAAAPYRHSPIF